MCAPQFVTRLGAVTALRSPQSMPQRSETTEETIARWRKAYNAKKREARRKRMEKPEIKELEQQRCRDRFQNNKEKITDTRREKYQNNAEYRQSVLRYQREWRQRKKVMAEAISN